MLCNHLQGFNHLWSTMQASLSLIAEIDEALSHLSLTPPDKRGNEWHTYLDSILDQRAGTQHA